MNNKQGKTLGKKILGVCEVTPTISMPKTLTLIFLGRPENHPNAK